MLSILKSRRARRWLIAWTAALAVVVLLGVWFHWLVGEKVFRQIEPDFEASPAEQFGYESLLDKPAFSSLSARY